MEYAPVNEFEVGAKVIAPPPAISNAPPPLRGLENVPAVVWFKINVAGVFILSALVVGRLDKLFTCKVPFDIFVLPP